MRRATWRAYCDRRDSPLSAVALALAFSAMFIVAAIDGGGDVWRMVVSIAVSVAMVVVAVHSIARDYRQFKRDGK